MADPIHLGGRIHFKKRDPTDAWAPQALCHSMTEAVRRDSTLSLSERKERVDQLTDMFFPTRFSKPADVAMARDICAECPVRHACLTHSLVNWEPYGIWGGQTERERRKTRRRIRQELGNVLTVEDVSSWLSTHPLWSIRVSVASSR